MKSPCIGIWNTHEQTYNAVVIEDDNGCRVLTVSDLVKLIKAELVKDVKKNA